MTARRKVAVIGLGAIGSMTLWRLADRGAEVNGYEASTPGHDDAAYGGRSRAYHVASYGQHASTHLELIRQALPLWRELEIAAHTTLVDHRGYLAVGAGTNADINQAVRFAASAKLRHELLSPSQAGQRFKLHQLNGDEIAMYTPEGGLFKSNRAVGIAINVARARGALVRYPVAVTAIEPTGSGVLVICSDGDRRRYDHAIVTVGHRIGVLISPLRSAITPTKIMSYWLRCQPGAAIGSPPGYRRTASAAFTFLPSQDGRHIKISRDATATARAGRDAADWPGPSESSKLPDDLADAVTDTLPAVELEPQTARAYIEGYTSDRVPLLGQVNPSITVLAGFSGTGFSKSPAYGDIAADFALLGQTARPVSPMSPARRL